MKFLMIVLAVRFVIALIDNNKTKKVEGNETSNAVRDPAAFLLR